MVAIKPSIPLNAWANDVLFKAIAPIYDPDEEYSAGELVLSPFGLLVSAVEDTSGEYDPDKWEEVKISQFLYQNGVVIDIGSDQYSYSGYALPAIDVEILKEIYETYSKGIYQVLKWEMLGLYCYFTVIAASNVSLIKSIDIHVHNQFHCHYDWDDTTEGIVNPDVIE